MPAVLRLYEDVFGNDEELALSAAARLIFVVHGKITVADRELGDEETWHGEEPMRLRAGASGACCWRWELTSEASSTASGARLSARLDTLPAGDLLLRGDSVSFPPGGCAYLHRHQGPGIRCLIEGGIRIDSNGRSTSYGPGCAWYESGPDPVFAQAADRLSRFVRVMILPRELIGRSSLALVNPADAAKPRAQQYRIFVDAPIARPAGV